jgi:hypothetical protein
MPSKFDILKQLAQIAAKPSVNRIDMAFKDVSQRIPELTTAANLLKSGQLSAEEYARIVNALKPVKPYDFIPKPATKSEAIGALAEPKKPAYGGTKQMEAGERADLRLDIPAYTQHGVWVNSIHRKDAPTVYSSTSSVDKPEMILPQEKAMKVATGETAKSPFAVIRGEWNPLSEGEAVKGAQKYLNDPDWIQVGMDPERHSYFYDRKTMQPVVGGEKAIQVGPLVLVKNPLYADQKDFKFSSGGKVSQDAMNMAIMNQKVQRKAEGSSADDFELKRSAAGSVMPLEGEIEAAMRAATVNPLLARQAARRRGEYVPEAPQMPVEEPQATIKPYDPTFRQKAAELIERGLRSVSPADRARAIAQEGIMGVGGLGVADFVPFIGTGMALQEAQRGIEEARREGKPEEAWAELLGGVAAAAPGIGPTVKMAKPVSKALANEAAYRIYQAMERGEGPLAGALAGVAPRKMIPPSIAESLSTKRSLPEDDLFKKAIENTSGARITDQGVIIPLERRQVPEQIGEPSVRGGVFYLPEGSEQMKYYTGRGGYGGKEKISGETLISNPLFVKGSTGGKAPEAAYDKLLGKGAYQKMRTDALHWSGGPKDIREEAVTKFLNQYAPEMADQAWYILQNSKQGNQLAYALQEAAVGSAARKAGYDAILGYGTSRKTKQPFISEVFDVREINYPAKGMEPEIWPEYKAEGGITSDDLIIEENPL